MAVLVVLAAVAVVRIAVPVLDAVAELLQVFLIVAGVIVGVGAAGPGLLDVAVAPHAGRRGPRHAPASHEDGAGRPAAPKGVASARPTR